MSDDCSPWGSAQFADSGTPLFGQRCTSLTIWAVDTPPPVGPGVILWKGYEQRAGQIALLRMIDEGRGSFRARFLDWLDQIGRLDVRGRSIIDRLQVADGLSYWWLTRVAECNYLASNSFLNVIRVMALEEIIRNERPSTVRLVGGTRSIRRSIQELCRSADVEIKCVTRPRHKNGFSSLTIRGFCPKPIVAVLQMARWYSRTRLLRAARRANKINEVRSEDSVLLCTYNILVPGEEDAEEKAYQRYWGGLPDLLRDSGVSITWLHNLHASPGRPLKSFVDHLAEDAKEGRDRQQHVVLQSWLSPGVIAEAVLRWVRLIARVWMLGGLRRSIGPSQSPWLWHLMQSDWADSVYRDALMHLVDLGLYDRALTAIPPQPRGVVLYENQPWEQAFGYWWRRRGHGELIGAAHVMVRYWDLRYFRPVSPRSAADEFRVSVDHLALNGATAVDTCREAGMSMENLIEVEALRFEYLSDLETENVTRERKDDGLDILVLGDYDLSSTAQVLSMVRAAVPLVDFRLRIGFRGHPSTTIDPDDYRDLDICLVRQSLEVELDAYDAVLSGNFTSASLERHLMGMPTIVMLDTNGLNFSPLAGVQSSRFAGSATELASHLTSIAEGEGGGSSLGIDKFFWLDAEFPRWGRALSLAGGR